MAIGPTSPGHFPPARSYHSPQSDSLSSVSPGFTVRTGGRAANVEWPIVGLKRCVVWPEAIGTSAAKHKTSIRTVCIDIVLLSRRHILMSVLVPRWDSNRHGITQRV